MHERWNERLSEYLDGELSAADRAAVDAHLAACDVCREDLEALRAVTARARALPDTVPDVELWSGIAARIDAAPATFTPRPTRRFAFTLPQLVAASLALILSSGGLVWLTRLGAPGTDIPSGFAEAPPAVRP